jgi:hypothetical protein
MLGVCKYIKENYPTEKYQIYGSSAGSWDALYLSIPLNNEILFDNLSFISKFKYSTLYELETILKNLLLSNIEHTEYKCTNINICLTSLKIFDKKKIIINKFNNVEDIVECCMASSHLPFISNGDFFYVFNHKKYIDGGVFSNNYPKEVNPDLIIYPKMFKNKNIRQFSKLTTLNIEKLIYEGYKDARNNANYLHNCLSN